MRWSRNSARRWSSSTSPARPARSAPTRSCEAAPDGYTWASGAAGDIGCYKVLGFLDTKITDWTLYLAAADISVISVNNYTPYQTMDQLLAAWKAGKKITVATTGQAFDGHIAIESIRKYVKFDYTHLTYNGTQGSRHLVRGPARRTSCPSSRSSRST